MTSERKPRTRTTTTRRIAPIESASAKPGADRGHPSDADLTAAAQISADPITSRGCAGCAERDTRVRQLSADLADSMEAMEQRVFTVAGIALGAALVAVVLGLAALGYAGRREVPEWSE
jgi:hypothetical protein